MLHSAGLNYRERDVLREPGWNEEGKQSRHAKHQGGRSNPCTGDGQGGERAHARLSDAPDLCDGPKGYPWPQALPKEYNTLSSAQLGQREISAVESSSQRRDSLRSEAAASQAVCQRRQMSTSAQRVGLTINARLSSYPCGDHRVRYEHHSISRESGADKTNPAADSKGMSEIVPDVPQSLKRVTGTAQDSSIGSRSRDGEREKWARDKDRVVEEPEGVPGGNKEQAGQRATGYAARWAERMAKPPDFTTSRRMSERPAGHDATRHDTGPRAVRS